MTEQLCQICPRKCGAVRNDKVGHGACKMPSVPVCARAGLHYWEEPCISGKNGSGTIFFSGCVLQCRFCQNYQISKQNFGKPISIDRLAEIFRELEEMGANNINLVSGTHFVPQIINALDKYKPNIPIVYNCGGYELVQTIEMLADYVDIWLPDLKYASNELGKKYSGVGDYFDVAARAIEKMASLCGENVLDDNGIMQKGMIIRHLILPANTKNSIAVLDWIKQNMPPQTMVSLMSQYTPCGDIAEFPELNRRITRREYDKVVGHMLDIGLLNGYVQDKSSAKEEYIPAFDLTGL